MSYGNPDCIFPINWPDDEPTFKCHPFDDEDEGLNILIKTSAKNIDSHMTITHATTSSEVKEQSVIGSANYVSNFLSNEFCCCSVLNSYLFIHSIGTTLIEVFSGNTSTLCKMYTQCTAHATIKKIKIYLIHFIFTKIHEHINFKLTAM